MPEESRASEPRNVDIVRRAITAYFVSESPDVAILREVFDPDCVVTTGWGADSTEHHGLQGALAARAEMTAVWDSWEQEIERVLDAGGGNVVALLRLRARGRESGVPVDAPWAMVVTLRNRSIVTVRAFPTHDEALEAAGVEA